MELSVRKPRPYQHQIEMPLTSGVMPGKTKMLEEAQGFDGLAKRKVHCFQPFGVQAGFKPVNPAIHLEAKPLKRVPSQPMAIPGAETSAGGALPKGLTIPKKITTGGWKADPIDHSKYTSAHALPSPKGSWTDRQMKFNPEEVPVKHVAGAQAKNGMWMTSTKLAKLAQKTPTDEEPSPEHIAWRYHMKKKWIREELHARKQDFPDDPDYEDLWQDAGDFITKNGYKSAMQAAFMGASREKEGAVESHDIESVSSFEDLSFEDLPDEQNDDIKSDREAKMLSRAATLVRLSRNVKASRV